MESDSISIVFDLLEGKSEWRAVPEIVFFTFKAIFAVLQEQQNVLQNLDESSSTFAQKEDFIALQENLNRNNFDIKEISKENKKEFIRISDEIDKCAKKKDIFEITRENKSKELFEESRELFLKNQNNMNKLEKDLKNMIIEQGLELEKKNERFVKKDQFEQIFQEIEFIKERSREEEESIVKLIRKKADKKEIDLELEKFVEKKEMQRFFAILEKKAEKLELEPLKEKKVDRKEIFDLVNEITVGQFEQINLAQKFLKENFEKRFNDERNKMDRIEKDCEEIKSGMKNSSKREKNFSVWIEEVRQEIEKEIEIFFEERRKDFEGYENFANGVKEDLGRMEEQWIKNEKILKKEYEKTFNIIEKKLGKITDGLGGKAEKNDIINLRKDIDERTKVEEVQIALDTSQANLASRLMDFAKEFNEEIAKSVEKLSLEISESLEVKLSKIATKEELNNEQIRNNDKFEKLTQIIEKKMDKKELNNINIEKILKKNDDKFIEIKKQLEEKAGVKELCALIDSKADISSVNRVLRKFGNALANKTNEKDFSTYVESQDKINKMVYSESLFGKWIWQNGGIDDDGKVLWNEQIICTIPENFIWQKGKNSILIMSQGFYQILFGFSNNKDDVFLYLNGEKMFIKKKNHIFWLESRTRVSIEKDSDDQKDEEGYLCIKKI